MPSGIEVVFLGTGGSLPTKGRGLPSVAIRRDGELLLFDCGEGTQRQMMHAGLGFNRPTSTFISHLHGDHLLGLPGLVERNGYSVRTALAKHDITCLAYAMEEQDRPGHFHLTRLAGSEFLRDRCGK